MTIKLNSIIPAPWNTRGEITSESVADLAKSIEEQGLIQPIVVWKNSDGEFVCIAGNRRLAALREIGYELEEADTVIFDGDESDAKMITVTENLQREDVGPIEEAALVAKCLDAGTTAEEIAAKTGRSASWVNRRRKLITLDEAWRKCTALPADALEKIAAYPAEVQKKVAKVRPNPQSWVEVKWHFESESKDLDAANFDTDECRSCCDRTGCMADLFGDVEDGKLGRCLNAKCFAKRHKAHVDALIESATNGAGEVVRVKYAWELPSGEKASTKKSKAHPCAYVHEYDGDVKVVWGESQKAKKEREAAEQARRNEQSAADEADRKRAGEITDKLDAWKDETDDDGWPNGLKKIVVDALNDDMSNRAEFDFVTETIRDAICGWHDNDEWAKILTAFPSIAQLAGLSDEDAAYLIDEYADDGNDDDDNE